MALERSATIKPDCAATALITVLISGRGSNLKSLIENQNGYRVAAVVSNNPQAAGLELAAHYKIPSFIVARESYSSLAEFKAGVLAAVMETNPDFVALAGFMMMLSPQFIAEFEGRLINIHPSLLPELSGLNTHARAVSAGVKRHGCSAHFVDAGLDTGPLIAQSALELLPNDDATSAAARVLTLEHVLYTWVLSRLACGDIRLHGRSVYYSAETISAANERGFIIFQQ